MSASSVLTLSGDLSYQSGVVLTKQGPGTLEVNHVRSDGLSIGGLVKIASNGGVSGVSNVKSLTIAGDIDAWTGGLDLRNDGAVAVDYSDTSPLAALANQLKSGFAGGSWSGITGVTSSSTRAAASATDDKTAIGYAEASAVGSAPQLQRHCGPESGDIVYTYSGDANPGRGGRLNFDPLAGVVSGKRPVSIGPMETLTTPAGLIQYSACLSLTTARRLLHPHVTGLCRARAFLSSVRSNCSGGFFSQAP